MREQARENISASLRGKFGINSRRWKGNKAGYVAKHLWVKKHFGRKDRCEQCGKRPPEVSRLELANISGRYLRIVSDWQTLCTSCHLKRDFRARIKACPQGHFYTEENTIINNRGHRQCKICRSLISKRYRERMVQSA